MNKLIKSKWVWRLRKKIRSPVSMTDLKLINTHMTLMQICIFPVINQSIEWARIRKVIYSNLFEFYSHCSRPIMAAYFWKWLLDEFNLNPFNHAIIVKSIIDKNRKVDTRIPWSMSKKLNTNLFKIQSSNFLSITKNLIRFSYFCNMMN